MLHRDAAKDHLKPCGLQPCNTWTDRLTGHRCKENSALATQHAAALAAVGVAAGAGMAALAAAEDVDSSPEIQVSRRPVRRPSSSG